MDLLAVCQDGGDAAVALAAVGLDTRAVAEVLVDCARVVLCA